MRMTPNYVFLIRVSFLLALANSAIMGALTWFLWSQEAVVPLWGQRSMISHLFVVSFVMSFFMSIIASRLTQHALVSRKILPLHWHLKNQTMFDRLPSNILHRSFIISLMGCWYAFLLVYLLKHLTNQELETIKFVKLNIMYSIWLAAGASVLSIYRTLGSPFIKRNFN